ncbi:MAG: hypothetical protein ACREFY_19120 [Acetobacteraceae bacterium]
MYAAAAPARTAIIRRAPDTTYLGRTVWNGADGTIYGPQDRIVAHLRRHGNTITEYNPEWQVTGKTVIRVR